MIKKSDFEKILMKDPVSSKIFQEQLIQKEQRLQEQTQKFSELVVNFDDFICDQRVLLKNIETDMLEKIKNLRY
jgi:hypothetical protein